VSAPLKVAFPGGALEAGEIQLDAVRREMREELGVEVDPLESFWRYEFPDRPLVLWGWRARLDDAQALRPEPREIHEVLWLLVGEARGHPDRTAQMESFIAALLRALEHEATGALESGSSEPG